MVLFDKETVKGMVVKWGRAFCLSTAYQYEAGILKIARGVTQLEIDEREPPRKEQIEANCVHVVRYMTRHLGLPVQIVSSTWRVLRSHVRVYPDIEATSATSSLGVTTARA